MAKFYHVLNYGCQMNEHDSENIKAILEGALCRAVERVGLYLHGRCKAGGCGGGKHVLHPGKRRVKNLR